MRIFISAGEPSGDLHGANFIRAFQRLCPQAEFTGYGGDLMAAAGCRLHYPLCQLSVMWFLRVLANLHLFADLVARADRYFRHQQPDAVVLIDYPGMHWWLARRARFHGIPVFYFVPPQIWAWASWRVEKMRRYVDQVLCTLPFEKAWYEERGVQAHYVGHPYFDELTRQRLDGAFLDRERARGGRIIALLPGSRTQELQHNFKSMVRAASVIHAQMPETRFLVANFKESQRALADRYLAGRGLPIETHVGRTPEIIRLAEACVSVSGSVSLELLYQARPAVIVYQVSPLALRVGRFMMRSRYITLVNLLAERELFPEYLTDRCEAEAIAGHLLGWLKDESSRQARIADLRALCREVARPGACARAAEQVWRSLTAGRRRAAA